MTGLPVTRIARAASIPSSAARPSSGSSTGTCRSPPSSPRPPLVAAVLERRDAVVLSNEWSASVPTARRRRARREPPVVQGRRVRAGFGELVLATLGPGLSVFSYLRPRSELWVAAAVRAAHPVPPRLSQLQPRLPPGPGAAARPLVRPLRQVLLRRPRPRPVHGPRRARRRVRRRRAPARTRPTRSGSGPCSGLGAGAKPFECVGDTDECRAAALLAARRDGPRRHRAARSGCAPSWPTPRPPTPTRRCSQPRGTHRIPDRYAPTDLLVRAR